MHVSFPLTPWFVCRQFKSSVGLADSATNSENYIMYRIRKKGVWYNENPEECNFKECPQGASLHTHNQCPTQLNLFRLNDSLSLRILSINATMFVLPWRRIDHSWTPLVTLPTSSLTTGGGVDPAGYGWPGQESWKWLWDWKGEGTNSVTFPLKKSGRTTCLSEKTEAQWQLFIHACLKTAGGKRLSTQVWTIMMMYWLLLEQQPPKS